MTTGAIQAPNETIYLGLAMRKKSIEINISYTAKKGSYMIFYFIYICCRVSIHTNDPLFYSPEPNAQLPRVH